MHKFLLKTCIYIVNLIYTSFEMFSMKTLASVALLITEFVSFIAIGPITFFFGNLITGGVVAIFDFAPFLGGLIYGGLYAPLVISGIHQTLERQL